MYHKSFGRQVAHQRLAGSMVGDRRLFEKKSQKSAPNTAVHLLVDCSSSMKQEVRQTGNKLTYAEIANRAALALALALEGIDGVSLEVSYFPCSDSNFAVSRVLERRQRARSRAVYFDQMSQGTTPMAAAIWYAANRLLKAKETRKLIIVVTDGKPDNISETESIIQRCSESGFDLLGVGIATTSVTSLFKQHVVIQEVRDLKSVLFGKMEKVLVG